MEACRRQEVDQVDFKGIMTDAISTFKDKTEYMEIRIEQRESVSLLFRLANVDQVSARIDLGGNVRAIVNGGWGFAAFNDISAIEKGLR
ncbi:MAG: hypothetical protein MZV49_05185 [Rhodopseudomonas palustris]|nr:hypothetical protein [Rhodopseudomonas palustris]